MRRGDAQAIGEENSAATGTSLAGTVGAMKLTNGATLPRSVGCESATGNGNCSARTRR